MKRNTEKIPVITFTVPPYPPAPVSETLEQFRALGARWAELSDELREARAAVPAAKRADVEAGAEAFAKGEAPERGRREADARARVSTLEAQREALAAAIDQVGNDLAFLIAEHAEPWARANAEAEEKASAHFASAIEDAQAALADLSQARGAGEWLAEFNSQQAVLGNQRVETLPHHARVHRK